MQNVCVLIPSGTDAILKRFHHKLLQVWSCQKPKFKRVMAKHPYMSWMQALNKHSKVYLIVLGLHIQHHSQPTFCWLAMAKMISKSASQQICTSNSEYLVRNRAQAANQQDLAVKFALCKACSVYCIRVLCGFLKVCSMCCTMCAVCIVQCVQ